MDLSSLQRQLPQILSKKREKVSRFFTVESLDLRFSNNTEATYERIYGGNGAVMAVPFDGRDFYLISEYACGFERYELGLVKGKIDDGEDPKVACNRELQEEIGFGARNIMTLKSVMTLAPGMMSLKMHSFLCTELYPMQLTGDEPEPINIIKVSPKEISLDCYRKLRFYNTSLKKCTYLWHNSNLCINKHKTDIMHIGYMQCFSVFWF